MSDKAYIKSGMLFFLYLLAIFSGGFAAQSQPGSLFGRVLDQSGAAVGHAVVEMRFEGSPMVRSVRTDESGSFGFDRIQPGHYSLIAQGTGFEAAVLNIELLAGEVRAVDLTLKVAQISEQVVVNSSSILGNPDRLPHIPGAVDVITASDLASSNIFTLNEAVRKIAGINARDEEGFGLRPNIGIRGLNPTRSSKARDQY